ncbi:MAG: M1 family metallopeptidase [Vicinamibacterales bacterium]|mgnify:CR=1 FL=1
MSARLTTTFGLALTALVLATGHTTQAQGARSPRNANYTISARLDAKSRTITAHERISWRNITKAPTGALQFHVYWNAWADTKSTWMKETQRTRPVERPPSDFSRIDISSIELLTPASQPLANRRFIAPDDGNTDDKTVMAVSLPAPVQPGETIELAVDWTAKVPRTFDRTGTIGNYFFIAQWFPKLGVLEDSGWNTHQFHSATEFFSDYGVYDVSLTVPAGWIVGATGIAQNVTTNTDGTATHRYVQEDVHDFAWTTSPDFVVRTARFEETGLPPVEMRLLLQPEHLSQAERHFAATRVSLKQYGTWYGPYPYGHITIVDPAYQSDTGGMEYPTLFTAGTQWWISPRVTRQTPEEVVVHEAGHQFWYGISGSNEFEHAWMDEGINEFSTARAMATDYRTVVLDRYYFGGFVPWTFADVHLSRDTDLNDLWRFRTGATQDTLGTPSFRQRPETVFVFAYDKPAVWLNTLERWLGWPVLQRGLHDAFSAASFSHPEPDVVLSAIERAAGKDLTRFYDQTYRGSASFDYSVDKVTSSAAGSGQFLSRVTVRRLGDGIFPTDVLVTFDDGEQVTEQWDGEARWREFTYRRKARVQSAVVDPNRRLLLDMNFTNNSRTVHPRTGDAARKWTLKWMVWLQDALLTWGLFA